MRLYSSALYLAQRRRTDDAIGAVTVVARYHRLTIASSTAYWRMIGAEPTPKN